MRPRFARKGAFWTSFFYEKGSAQRVFFCPALWYTKERNILRKEGSCLAEPGRMEPVGDPLIFSRAAGRGLCTYGARAVRGRPPARGRRRRGYGGRPCRCGGGRRAAGDRAGHAVSLWPVAPADAAEPGGRGVRAAVRRPAAAAGGGAAGAVRGGALQPGERAARRVRGDRRHERAGPGHGRDCPAGPGDRGGLLPAPDAGPGRGGAAVRDPGAAVRAAVPPAHGPPAGAAAGGTAGGAAGQRGPAQRRQRQHAGGRSWPARFRAWPRGIPCWWTCSRTWAGASGCWARSRCSRGRPPCRRSTPRAMAGGSARRCSRC